jgi:hypothetical protein
MSGLDSTTPTLTAITPHKASNLLDVASDNGQRFSYSDRLAVAGAARD